MNKLLLLVTTMTTSLLAAERAKADDWTFQLEPYMMATQIQGDASIGRAGSAPVDVDFSTIVDNLEMAAMLHFEAHHKSGWGVMMDYGFMDLSQSTTNSRDGVANLGLRQGVLETLGLYRVKYGKTAIDYFGGARWWDNDLSLSLDAALTPEHSTNLKVKEDWIDAVVGVRVSHELNDDWHIMARADVGGFGASSDFTSTVEAGVAYQMTELMSLTLKYKASWVDYANSGTAGEVGHYVYDTVTHGAVIGLRFSF